MKNAFSSLGFCALLSTSALALSLSLAAPASAQVTTSAVSGTLVDNSGQPISGASVTILYAPTGATQTTTTSTNGAFFASGLRVGGPYTITATNGSDSVIRNNLRFQPSANNVRLEMNLDEVVAVGVRTTTLDLNGGVGSAFSADDIINQPSSTRDLVATLIRDPLANSSGEGNLSVAGVNPKFNALAIDGSLQGDDFGLSTSTYATDRSPISLDIIESASIVASDYSVTSSGFTGGLVNVVTKSGTNEIDGSVYYYKQNEDFIGDKSFDRDFDVEPFEEEEYGFVLSGPIIKDKLFFLVSYDEFTSGSGREFTQADADDGIDARLYSGINQIVQDTYGFDLGGRPDSVSLPVTSERFFGKIDWEINADHRASFSYQDTKENGFSGVGQTNFQSAYYATPQTVKAYTAQLFSNWTDTLSTNLRVNFKDNERGQQCNAGDTVGAFEIRLSEADLEGTSLAGFIDDGDGNIENFNAVTLNGGCDRFRQGNTFADERLQVFGSANYNLGDHYLTFGAEFQNYNLDNLFAETSGGSFRYESIADLRAGLASRVQVKLPDTGDREDIRAVWGYDQLALFAGDSWQMTPDLRIDYGLRYERILQDDKPQERTFFENTYGFSNTMNLDGLDLFMPRASFNYTPFERTTLSGGFGLYGGGSPAVWVSNAFTPPVFFAQAFNVANTNPADGTPPSLLALIQANDANDPGPIDVIGRDFETPSDWKASLQLDQEFDLNFGQFSLGDNYQLSLRALFTETNKGFRWENLAQTELNAALPIGVAPDGRPIYADLDDLNINNAISLTNYEGGTSTTLSASLSKDYDNGLGFFASYAHQDIDTATTGSGTRGVSAFRGIISADRNNPAVGRSPYETEHSFKLNLSFEREIIGNLTSRFDLFGQMRSGTPFSYTFDIESGNALFGRPGSGESPFDNDLLYVPNIAGASISDDNVVLATGFQETDFVDYVGRQGLSTGGIVGRNSDTSNWSQNWDFRYEQEIPFFNKKAEKFVGENRLKFVFNIDNVGNFLNSDWGTDYYSPNFGVVSLVSADLVSRADVDANGVDMATALTGDSARTTCTTSTSCVYRFNDFDEDPISSPNRFGSLYQIRVGVRYEF